MQWAVKAAKRDYVQETLNSKQNTKQGWNTLKSITEPQKPETNCAPIIDSLPMLPRVFCDLLNMYHASVGGDYINSPENPNPPVNATTLDPLSRGEIKLLLNRLNTN